MQERQIVQENRDMWVGWPKGVFRYCQGPLVQGLRLGKLALRLVQPPQIVQGDRYIGMGWRRAFWVGAAIFGWGYLLVVHDQLVGVVGTGEDLLHAYTALLLSIAGGTLARYFCPTKKNETD